MSQKLRRIMTENVVTIEPNATVKEAAELMNMHEIGCLIVVHSGKPIGILTERDMLNRIVYESRDSRKVKTITITSKPLITASANMRAGDAAKLMLERNIKKLPIVENGRLIGLVTLTDLIRSPGVVEFLNKLSLDGTSKRLKKAIHLYFDPLKQHRRKCPLMLKDGFQMGCQDDRCMWWAGDECAVTRISRQIAVEELSETSVPQEKPYTD